MMTAQMAFHPASCREVEEEALRALREGRIVERIRQRDHTLWKPDPREIADRLGWLKSPLIMTERLPEIGAFVEAVRAEGFRFVLLLGMGGSSLAPEVFRRIFGAAPGFLDLAVLDSTDPGAVLGFTERLDVNRTLFVVSTKSGGTVETFSFLRYFYNLAADRLGNDKAGRHFAAITDPGSALAELAVARRFRHAFLNDPEIGGRYSALSFFGLVPAALIGMDTGRLIERAAAAARQEFSEKQRQGAASGAALGALLGRLAGQGRDKLTFFFSPSITPFGDWLEQLIAESTGKEGRGILPVVGEELEGPEAYGPDRCFVFLRAGGDETGEEKLRALAAAGHPVVDLRIADPYDLGGQCFLWEVATAVAGARLGINPFDQPDVESAKALARKMIATYREKGELPPEEPVLRTPGISVYGPASAAEVENCLASFLGQAATGAYAAIQAFVTPTPRTGEALERLRLAIRARFRLAATVGYGPRFLHSTGQLHKGDAGKGLFIQLTADDARDVPIPDELGAAASSLSFGILKAAQAFGDRQALVNAGRRVIRFHLHGDPVGGIRRLAETLGG
ncbi:MAG: glucose-6-phosphate isomerase [Deltaproteobacteria bacterium]|nr:glucose-6-phosphate isomerase [Deltaproteobacteria bacterium]